MNKEIITLRGHHINCLFFFKGLGYSREFVEKMTNIRNMLLEDDNREIKVVIGADDVCSDCPHLSSEKKCITDNKVNNLDRKTIKEYSLIENNTYSMSHIKENIYGNFDKDKFITICNQCQWFKDGVCSENIIEEMKEKWKLK